LGRKRKNICEGLEHVQEKNLKGKECRILGMISREAYQGLSPDSAFPFVPFALVKNITEVVLLGLVR
jgi:hypothetical protein